MTGTDCIQGINFASQDYLSLSSHLQIKQLRWMPSRRSVRTVQGRPPCWATPPTPSGWSRELSAFLNGRQVVLYATGWQAGYASVRGLCGPTTMW